MGGTVQLSKYILYFDSVRFSKFRQVQIQAKPQRITGLAVDKGGNRLAKGDLLTVRQLELLAIGFLYHEDQEPLS